MLDSALLLAQGILVGVLASIPLGPIGVLCVQRTINYGRIPGFASGYGAALADTIFATIAAWGLSFIIEYIQAYRFEFEMLGGVVILAMGIIIYRRDPIKIYRQRNKVKRKLWQDSLYTMLITLTNPLAIFLFLALMTAFGVVVYPEKPTDLTLVVAGVHIGAVLWWFNLTYLVNKMRRLFGLRTIWWFNKTSGIVITIFGVIALLHGTYLLAGIQ